jgi:hypothetical protein
MGTLKTGSLGDFGHRAGFFLQVKLKVRTFEFVAYVAKLSI